MIMLTECVVHLKASPGIHMHVHSVATPPPHPPLEGISRHTHACTFSLGFTGVEVSGVIMLTECVVHLKASPGIHMHVHSVPTPHPPPPHPPGSVPHLL